MIKPELKDFPEFYRRYIAEVIETDILKYFTEQKTNVISFFSKFDETKALYKYQADKWSIKEILGHICDAERIFTIRALQFARGETQQLPGFEEDDYVANANFNDLPLTQLVDDFRIMRESHISLFNTFNDELWKRKGVANKTEYSVFSILYIMAGHIDHHLKVIEAKYLNK